MPNRIFGLVPVGIGCLSVVWVGDLVTTWIGGMVPGCVRIVGLVTVVIECLVVPVGTGGFVTPRLIDVVTGGTEGLVGCSANTDTVTMLLPATSGTGRDM